MLPLLLLLCLQTSFTHLAPVQLQLLQQLLQPQQTSLQQQLMELQQLQALKRLSGLPAINLPRPLLILLPNSHQITDSKPIPNLTHLRNPDPKKHYGIEDDEADSIVIDAEPETQPPAQPTRGIQKAVLLVPNDGRFSIGDFISSIPFLPIEINVPDSISWIYNGISSIISGIGQRLPFRPQTLDALESNNPDQSNVRLKTIGDRIAAPLFVIPMGQPFPAYK